MRRSLVILTGVCNDLRSAPTPIQKWSTRSRTSGTTKDFKYCIRNLLQLLSGDDLVGMILDVVPIDQRLAIAPAACSTLSSLATIYNATTPRDKAPIMRAIKNGNSDSAHNLTLEEVRGLGFKVQEDMWTSCADTTPHKPAGPPTSVSTHQMKDLVQKHLSECSNPMP